MKCMSCGKPVRLQIETRKHDIGLDEPITVEGAEVARCANCGEEYVGIPRERALLKAVAHEVATKRPKLTAAEIRFLRTYLGLSSNDFAQVIGVDPSTVSRWENGHQDMGEQTERLLRLLALVGGRRVSEYPLGDFGSEAAVPSKIRARLEDGYWRAA